MSAHDAAWQNWLDRADAVDIGDVALRLQPQLRRAGADLVGACPKQCATSDGFVVSPKKGIFLCRPSGETGGSIKMVQHALDCDYVEAVEFITQETRPDRKHEETAEERAAREKRQAKLKRDADARTAQAERDAEAKRRRDEEAVADVLRRAVPIAGTHADAYLREGRGLTPAKRLTGDLKFVAELDYWGVPDDATEDLAHLATLPAMVAIIRDVGGAVLGIHQTFLDPREPVKWKPPVPKKNGAKKVRKIGESVTGGMIRFGMIGDKLAMGEGIETTLSWHALGYGPENVTLAAAVSLNNLAGRWTGTLPHPTRVNPKTGKPTRVPNGIPDMDRPGVVLPDDVAEVILLGDGDSEPLATRGALLTAGRRFRAQGRTVAIHFAPDRFDWNDVLMAQRADERECAA